MPADRTDLVRMGFKLLIVACILVALPIGLVAGCARSFLYYPSDLGPRQLSLLAARPGWQIDRLPVEPGIELCGLVRPPANTGSGWLLFFGGNAMGLAAGQAILELVAGEADLGLAVWAYRGYDGSGGRPTQVGLCRDAEAQIAHLRAAYGVAPSSLVLVGQSLGSGIAAHASAHLQRAAEPPRGLLLLSPYTSIAQVFDDVIPLVPVGWAVADAYRTDELADQIPAPVLIVHGTADTLIRPRHGERLAALLGDKVELFWVAGAGHNDLWDAPPAVRRMQAFVRSPQLSPGSGRQPSLEP